MGIEAIAKALYQQGKRTRRRGTKVGGVLFDRATVRWILTSKVYASGVWEQHYGGEVYSAEVPLIIDQALWDKVQVGLDARRSRGGAPANTHEALSRGIGFCPCGRTLYVMPHSTNRRDPKDRHLVYVCASRRERHPDGRKAVSCGHPTIRVAEADRAVWEAIVNTLNDPATLLEAVKDRAVAPVQDSRATWEAQIAGAEKALAKLSKKATALADMRADELVSEEDYRKQFVSLKTERANLERTREVARQAIANATQVEAVQMDMAGRLQCLQQKLADHGAHVPFAVRREVVLTLVPKLPGLGIVMHPDGQIVINGLFPTEPAANGDRPCDPAEWHTTESNTLPWQSYCNAL